MEGVTDFPFRRWLSLCSKASYHSTPFLRITNSYPHKSVPIEFAPEIFDPDYKSLLSTPVVLQVMGPSPTRVIDIGKMILQYTDFFDINFGCPAPTVIGKGSGSALLQDPKEFESFTSMIAKNLPDRSFSLKIRTGFNDDSKYDEIISIIESLNAKRLTIHGRTKAQKYTGEADWSQIEFAAKSLSLPVIGSGDITNYTSYVLRKQKAPSLTGVIIGRGAISNPWIFDSIRKPENSEINQNKVLSALLVYGIFIDLYYDYGYQKFKDIDFELNTVETALNEEQWYTYLHRLIYLAYGYPNITHLSISRRALSRIKMLWTKMKDLLPEQFEDRSLLRSKRIEDFVQHFKEAQKKASSKNRGKNLLYESQSGIFF